MSKTVLWIDDEYNSFTQLVSGLVKDGIKLEFVDTFIKAREMLEGLHKYDVIVLDIILPEGREYKLEEANIAQLRDRTYLGLLLLKEIAHLKKPVPKVVVLTIAEDPRVLAQLREYYRKGLVFDILRKGTLKEEDVCAAVRNAMETT